MNDLLLLFFDVGQFSQAPLDGQYNLWLVLLSYIMAFVASLAALNIFSRARNTTNKWRRIRWTLATAFVAGIGVWSMHFIGMIAFRLPIPVSHTVGLTITSILPAIVGNYIAYRLQLYVDQHANIRSWQQRAALLAAGASLGAGIGIMHYIGMAAMAMAANLRYHVGWFIASVVIAVVLGIVAMLTYHHYRSPQPVDKIRKRVLVSVAMIIAAAISGMHYVAMLAARFYPLPEAQLSANQTDHQWLIYAIVVAVLIVASFAWLSSRVDRRLQSSRREIMQSDRKIRELAYNDTLTGLPNRRSLLEYLDQRISAEGQFVALLLFDIDKFKVLNNTLGPEIGDMLLQAVSQRLERTELEVHMLARPSSNEFAAVMYISDRNKVDRAKSNAVEFASRMQDQLQQPYRLKDYLHRCSFSVGISLDETANLSAQDLLVQADLALAEAKRQGSGGTAIYHPSMAEAIEQRVAMESDLRAAIESEQQLSLYLQPQLNTERAVIGAEALLRWQHPDRGFISPAEFIPLAEETGLIIALGDWINGQACEIVKRWQQQGFTDWVLSINVSAPQFQQIDFVEKLQKQIQAAKIPAHALKIELTESVLMHNVDEVIGKINELKALGIQFALDDFGTGYSSLSYLMRLPFDVLKIDVEFVRDMFNNPEKEAIVQTIVQLAHNLGLAVVAEGVETERHFEFLRTLGCDSFQGYLFSAPVSEEMFNNNYQ